MKKILRTFAMLLVSCLLFGVALLLFKHGSSAAFDAGVGCVIFSIIHWVWWPDVKAKQGEC